MYGEILQAVKALATAHAAPYTSIATGAMPANDGLAMFLGSGGPDTEYLDRGAIIDIDIVLNGKHANQQTVVTALSIIHLALTQRKQYTNGVNWAIKNIRTTSTPNFIEQEASSKQWLYGSILEIKIEVKGV